MSFLSPSLSLESNGKPSVESIHSYLTSLNNFVYGNNLLYLPPKGLEQFYRETFSSLFICASHKIEQIQKKASKSLGLFLNFSMPFNPEQIGTTFISALEEKSFEVAAFPYIAAVFVHILNHISHPFKQQFIHYHDFTKYFTFTDLQYIEKVPGLIAKLDSPPTDWLKKLIDRYLSTYTKEHSIHFMRAMAAVIKHSPQILMDYFLENATEISSESIEIFGYILNTIPISKIDCDFYPIASIAFELLRNSPPNAVVENCLAILSKVGAVITIDDNLATIEIEELQFTVGVSSLSPRIAFYKFPIPFDYIKINNNDGVLITSQKIETISNNIEKYDHNDIVDMLEKFSYEKYNDKVAGIIRSLSNCSNYLLEKNEKFALILRRFCFAKVTTVNHAADLSLLFSKLDFHICAKYCGKGFLNDTLIKLYSLLDFNDARINKNTKKALKSINVENLDFIDFDFFYDINKTTLFIGAIPHNNTHFITLLIEELLFENDFERLIPIFNCLSKAHNLVNIKFKYDAVKIAEEILLATINVFRQQKVTSKFDNAIQSTVDKLLFDILAEESKFFRPAGAAIKFLAQQSYNVCNSIISSFSLLFSLIPTETSYFLANHSNLLQKISIDSNLKNCGSVKAHANVAKAIVANSEFSAHENSVSAFEHIIASQVLMWPSPYSIKTLGCFAILIGKTLKGAIPIVREFEQHLTHEEKDIFYGATKFHGYLDIPNKFDVKNIPDDIEQMTFQILEDGNPHMIPLLRHKIEESGKLIHIQPELFMENKKYIEKYFEGEVNNVKEAVELINTSLRKQCLVYLKGKDEELWNLVKQDADYLINLTYILASHREKPEFWKNKLLEALEYDELDSNQDAMIRIIAMLELQLNDIEIMNVCSFINKFIETLDKTNCRICLESIRKLSGDSRYITFVLNKIDEQMKNNSIFKRFEKSRISYQVPN